MNWLRRLSAARASLVITVVLTAAGTGACTLGGAAAGGYVGDRATNGSAVGTVGGAVAGGVIGYELSK